MPLTPGQAAHWNARVRSAGTNAERAPVLWDLARAMAGKDEAAWADLVRLLTAWTQARAGS
ncbi:hypothetical protein ACIG5E_33865 [Kitasatospora sp. NPDC053057]|uniref:hypothetical protein n=1 Tax=Kitasatospora sp. NPDC053057 TaxID=3364062 RepID=UPI0037C6FCFF